MTCNNLAIYVSSASVEVCDFTWLKPLTSTINKVQITTSMKQKYKTNEINNKQGASNHNHKTKTQNK